MRFRRRSFLAVLGGVLFVGCLMWAKGRDPFQRIWFKVKAPGQAGAECVAVLAKTAPRPLPVVIYLHGSGGELVSDGNELRQMAELGLAAVTMDYDKGNESMFEAQFKALLAWVGRQKWADTNRVAWVGLSLGAQRSLAFALCHPDLRPNLLVRVSGGWIPELDSQSLLVGRQHAPRTTNSPPGMSAFLVHGERDEVFPLADAQRVAAWLGTNAVPVELKLFPGEGHGFGSNRLLLFRALGEQCLTRLKGGQALENYRSILSWQAQAKPLWLYWIPAIVWVGWCWCARARKPETNSNAQCPNAPSQPQRSGFCHSLLRAWDLFRASGFGFRIWEPSTWWYRQRAPARLNRWEIVLRWAAVILVTAALGQTALHLVPPRLAITPRTLAIARKHLVQPKERSDFEFLAAKPFWPGKRLKILLEHVELANYNRELINWKLDDQIYRDYVLSPEIDPAADGDMNWRRPLWENFYPRIRKENSPEDAAEIIVRFLRERVTIAEGDRFPLEIADIWQRQITNARGFEAVYVAALRSAGVPGRLDSRHRAEFWTGARWQAAPRPLLEAWAAASVGR